MSERTIEVAIDVGIGSRLGFTAGHQMRMQQAGAPGSVTAGTGMLPGLGGQLGRHDETGIAECFLSDHRPGLIAAQIAGVSEDDLVNATGLAHADEAGAATRMTGVFHHQQMDFGSHGLGQVIPLVVADVAAGIIKIKVLQAGDLIARVFFLTLGVEDEGAMGRDMKHQYVTRLGTAGEPFPTLQNPALEAGQVEQELHIIGGKAVVIQQHTLQIMDIVDAAA